MQFGISRRAVCDIWNRKTWTHDTLPYWTEKHRLDHAQAKATRKRASLTADEAVEVYKHRPEAAHMRSAARVLSATVR